MLDNVGEMRWGKGGEKLTPKNYNDKIEQINKNDRSHWV